MRVYWDIVRFSFLRFFTYPLEIISQVLKRVVEILFLIYFWNLVIKTGGLSSSIESLASYFLIAMGISDLTMSRWGAFGSTLGMQLKSGQISNYLIKPVGILNTIYSIAVGRNGLRMMLAVISIAIGLLINFPKNPISILLFVIFFVNAFFISYAYNVFEGTLFIYFTDASGMRNVLQNSMRIVSGAMVPLYLFPSSIRNVFEVLPFANMVYWPAHALTISQLDDNVVKSILVGLFWAIFLNIIIRLFWRVSIRKYEAVGI